MPDGALRAAGEGLVIRDLQVAAGEKHVLRGINLEIPIGQTHVIFGPNGAGKSTLLAAIMGLPPARVLSGEIKWRGRNILELSTPERVELGIGLAFQRPPAIPGLRLRHLAELIVTNRLRAETGKDDGELEQQARRVIEDISRRLHVTDLLDRNVNEGFSGGELKRSEIFQLALQQPQLVLLDEPESGVDVENIRRIGQMLYSLLQRDLCPPDRKVAGLIITHSGHILEYVNADVAHVLFEGRLVCSGSPTDIFQHIQAHGFERCSTCPQCQRFTAQVGGAEEGE